MRDIRTPARGYTVIELLTVCVLIGVLTALALPRVNASAHVVDANARVVSGTLQQAWRLALQSQHDVIVNVDTAGHRIRLHADTDNDGIRSRDEHARWAVLSDGAAFGTPPSGIHGAVSGAATGSGLRPRDGFPSVVFHRDGSSSGDVEMYITAQRGPRRSWRAISLDQITGRAMVARYAGGLWTSVDQ